MGIDVNKIVSNLKPTGQNPISLRYPQGQFTNIINKNSICRTVHVFHVVSGLMVTITIIDKNCFQ